jgi:3-oxoadipate enol-lactonase
VPWVDSDGVRLAVEVVGEGKPVTVVGHGLTGSRRDFLLLAPLIPGTKVLFDFRGHGDSGRPPSGQYSMNHFAADVDSVAAVSGATAMVGISLGGGATLRLLRSKPDRFERLVFILPARLERSDPARARLVRLADLLERHPLEAVAEVVLAEEEAEGLFDRYPAWRDRRREAILGMNRDGLPRAIREVIDDPPVPDPEPLRRVVAPTLVVGQEGDPVHRADVARELAATLPKGELVLFEDRDAMLAEVAALTQRVAAFLAP